VTPLPAQTAGISNGLPQWLITYTPTGFVWFVGIGSPNSGVADIMVVHDYQDFFTPNLQSFVVSLDPVINAGIRSARTKRRRGRSSTSGYALD
jgi:hypothetical protein